MVKRTNDLYIVDEGPIIDILEDSSQEILKRLNKITYMIRIKEYLDLFSMKKRI